MHARDYSDDTARLIDEEDERILREQEDRARQLLTHHRRGLDLVAKSLLEKETVDGAEVVALVAQGLAEQQGATTGNGHPTPPPVTSGTGNPGGPLPPPAP
jgi:cell division protease FtsH